ncbi:MAG: hypothetical protein A2104_02370 [Candidatus Melainabacteria bacterium GWF2_32_7]|nr:MAG: hypothetical protein A2104_02370 [Candidatus Melainabacteria bacterium GWF2_32_7]OGI16999.1 MAG: hypothetical protein A2255_10030 [Candidatus Melainabacteria bacterium RIFOXYA2_FULL_32_9]
MRNKLSKTLISLIIITTANNTVFAESLFKTGVSQNVYTIQPRPLFSTVRAKSIGDLVTVLIDQEITASDDVQLNVKKSSDTTDNFSTTLNTILPSGIKRFLPNNSVPNMDDFGGGSETKNQTSLARTSKLKDVITTQVVQILPNGNLVVQGKKIAMNAGERVDVVISGIIDPRLLDNMGRIDSSLVANLQVAVVGKGTVSRSDSEGTVNKMFRYLF